MFNFPKFRTSSSASVTVIFLVALVTSACDSDKSSDSTTSGAESLSSAVKSAAPATKTDSENTETKLAEVVQEVAEEAEETVADVKEEVTEKVSEMSTMMSSKADTIKTEEVPAVTQKVKEAVVAATPEPVKKAVTSSAPNQADSLALARKSGCLACHAVDKKVVGPSWTDVAKRYAGNADAKTILTEKVKKGGRGNWTDVVGNAMMPPYSPRVSDDNIEKLVDFVISLNK